MLFGLITGLAIGLVFGWNRGWESAIKFARIWEGIARDYRMMVGVAMADTEKDRQQAVEVRQLEKMYDDV